MMNYLVIFYLAIPAFLANMSPIIVDKLGILESLAFPIDGGYKFCKKRLFGAHKTFRGFVVGIMVGLLTGFVMMILDQYSIVSIQQLSSFEFIIFGGLGGFGALAGDAIESFFKRQIGIKDGAMFFPFDQIDYIIGFMLFTFPFISWETKEIIFLLLCGAFLNPLVNLIGYILKLKKVPY